MDKNPRLGQSCTTTKRSALLEVSTSELVTRSGSDSAPGGLPKMTRQKLIALLASLLFTVSARADSLAYVVTDSDQFGTLNLSSGAFHQIGTDTPGQQFNLVPGPNGSLLSLTLSGNLESINTASGATTVIGASGLGAFNVGSFAECGGTLYATDGSNNLST